MVAFFAVAAPLVAQESAAQGQPNALRIVTFLSDDSTADMVMLLKRPDVQNALGLSVRQRRRLQELLQHDPQVRAETRVTVRASERDAALTEVETRPERSSDANSLMVVLTDSQKQRLRQLRLQWRGPLVIAEPDVAGALQLSSEVRGQITQIVSEYRRIKGEILQSLAQTEETLSPDGRRRSVAMKLDTAELERPFSPARRRLLKAKKEAEERILALLTDEEKGRWRELCGAPFSFRADLGGLRF